MKAPVVRLSIVGLVIGVALASGVQEAAAIITTCGSTVPGTPGDLPGITEVLGKNLVCDSTTGPFAVSLGDKATLNLNGYTIECVVKPGTTKIDGIFVIGRSATLKNGAMKLGCN
jgi:hypothetical protein